MSKSADACSIGIIGGADGPTAIYLKDRNNYKIPLRIRIRNKIAMYKRNRIHAGLQANPPVPHTLQETLQYACEKYSATELPATNPDVMRQKTDWWESLVLRKHPELTEEYNLLNPPDTEEEPDFHQIRMRSEWIKKNVPVDAVPTDFHVYKIVLGEGRLHIQADFAWDYLSVDYSGPGKNTKQFQKISADLYLYRGLTPIDIEQKTQRYHMLMAILTM